MSKWKINSVRREEFDIAFVVMAYLFSGMTLGGGIFAVLRWLGVIGGITLIQALQEWAGMTLLFLIYAYLGHPELGEGDFNWEVLLKIFALANLCVALFLAFGVVL